MRRGSSLLRLIRLLAMLSERGAVEVRKAAAELECSVRTVYRDLEVLEAAGVPIYQDTDARRPKWRVAEGFRRELKVSLSWTEMLALAAGKELLRGSPASFLHQAARSALEKIGKAMPAELAHRTRQMARHLSASPGSSRAKRIAPRVIEVLLSALSEQRSVMLRYRKPNGAAVEERRVDPYHVHLQASSLYLLGWCHQRRDFRVFHLDRIERVTTTKHNFVRRELARDAYFHGAFGAWSGEAERVRLRFPAESAAWMAERVLHASQRTERHDDGSLDVELEVPVSPPLVAHLLGWGPRVSVLEPARLRAWVRRDHLAGAKVNKA